MPRYLCLLTCFLAVALTSVALETGAAPAPVFRGVAKQVTNSIGMKLAYIPPGEFRMGTTTGDRKEVLKQYGEKDDPHFLKQERPEHQVRITRGFFMGVFEVTQAEFERVMGDTPSFFSATGEGKSKVEDLKTARFPVENVSYEDAVKFCKRLSARKREKEMRREYRLPTEAEWEYACRGGTSPTTPFHFGKSLSSHQANFDGNVPFGGAARGPVLARTCEVGSYKPNGFGLYDMHGNVKEWCSDWYAENHYAVSPVANPSGPKEGWKRAVRGGCFSDWAWQCRSASRHELQVSACLYWLGFRVAMVRTG